MVRFLQYAFLAIITISVGFSLYQWNASRAAVKLQQSSSVNLTNGLVGYWTFDGDDVSGTTAYDRSGKGNTGTLTNGPIRTAGKLGQALRFDGTDDYVNAGSASSLDDISAMTVSAWIYPRTATYGPDGMLVLKGSTSSFPSNEGTFYNGWTLTFNRSNPRNLEFGAKYSTTSIYKVAVSSAFVMNQWQHVVATWDGTSSASGIKIYCNGVEVSYFASQNGVGSRVSDNAKDFLVGVDSFYGGDFQGSLDEVRIYNRALSSTEVSALYNAGR